MADVIQWRQKQLSFLGHSNWYNFIIFHNHLKFMSWNVNNHLLWGKNNWPRWNATTSWNATNFDHNVHELECHQLWPQRVRKFLLLIKWSFKWEDQIIIIIFFYPFQLFSFIPTFEICKLLSILINFIYIVI